MTFLLRPRADGTLEWAPGPPAGVFGASWRPLDRAAFDEAGKPISATVVLPDSLLHPVPGLPLRVLTFSGMRWLYALRRVFGFSTLDWTVGGFDPGISVPFWSPFVLLPWKMPRRGLRTICVLAAVGLLLFLGTALSLGAARARIARLQQASSRLSSENRALLASRQGTAAQEANDLTTSRLRGWASWMAANLAAATTGSDVPERLLIQWDPPLDLGRPVSPERFKWTVELKSTQQGRLGAQIARLRACGLPVTLLESGDKGSGKSPDGSSRSILSGSYTPGGGDPDGRF